MKKLLQKYLPDQEKLQHRKSLRFLGNLLRDPRLWHLNRHSIPGAIFIGLFVCLLPIPFHTVLAAFLAVRFRRNLPLAAALVWVNTPLTYVPVFYFNYRIGTWLLRLPHHAPHGSTHMHMEWMLQQLTPLWLGSLVCATTVAGSVYLLVRLSLRLSVMRRWNARRHRTPHQEKSV